MIIKSRDDQTEVLATLERLRDRAEGATQRSIEAELRNLRAGIQGEKDAAYYLDFDLGSTKNWIVIHDLRIEVGGRVAQIDHLLIDRLLRIYVLESKSFHAGVKITNEGEFLRWNDWKKTYEGMPSPLAQNERHIAVLKGAISQIELPTRFGLRLEPTFESYVLISPKTRIDRPNRFDTSRVVKADVLVKTIQSLEAESAAKQLLAVTKAISQDALSQLGHRIAALHRPIAIDYAAKFGIAADVPAREADRQDAASMPSATQQHVCRHCQGVQLSVVYGKYGYYFKCAGCDGNTPIKVSCGRVNHKPRIRKDGLRFFQECAECQTSTLFFTNPAVKAAMSAS